MHSWLCAYILLWLFVFIIVGTPIKAVYILLCVYPLLVTMVGLKSFVSMCIWLCDCEQFMSNFYFCIIQIWNPIFALDSDNSWTACKLLRVVNLQFQVSFSIPGLGIWTGHMTHIQALITSFFLDLLWSKWVINRLLTVVNMLMISLLNGLVIVLGCPFNKRAVSMSS